METLKQRVCDVVSCKKNMELLQTKIQVLVAEVAQVRTLLLTEEIDIKEEIQDWFAQADEFLKEANDILECRNNMADKNRLCSTCWDPTSMWEIGELLRGIDKIFEKRQGLDLSSYFSVLSYCKKLQSREKILQEILEALMDIYINIIGLYGMVGVGKTILAKELVRYAQNNQLFDAIVMVQVSEYVDVKLIQSQIANKIGLQLSEADDEETRAHFLYNMLERKTMGSGQGNDTEHVEQRKILVIFDGVRCMIDLERVGIPCRLEGWATCKVVLISRTADICKKMGAEKKFLVDSLNLDEAKILFQERIGDKIENMKIALESYEYVENVFLIKCRGVPLVINSMACALRSMNSSDWQSIANQMERHTLAEVDEVKEVPSAIVELCNNFIQNGEKQKLFLLCCLIQRGGDVTLSKLMRYGIGFGLFQVDSFASIVGQFNSWVHELKSLSLLIEGKEPQHVKMHDIIQDVAISALSKGDLILRVLRDCGTYWDTRESYENCVAISMTPSSNYKCLSDLELYKLQAFLLKGTPFSSLPDNLFQGMQNLKILDISGVVFDDFPSSIGVLKNLVTLHLEYCDIRCGLKSMTSNLAGVLEVLSLRGSTFEGLPEEVGKLTKLRVLDFTDCQFSTFIVDSVAKLGQLRELYLCCSYWKWSTDDIGKLMSLPLEVVEIKIPQTCQVYPGALKFPNFLQRCIILYGDRLFHGPLHHDFTSFSCALMINQCNWLDFDNSGLRDILPKADFLLIEEVSGLKNGIGCMMLITRFSGLKMYASRLSGLRKMNVSRCDKMNCILNVDKISSFQGDVFPELENLTLEELPNLTSISCWQLFPSSFPKLRELRLRDLSQLHPYVLPIHLAARLKIMEVSNCASLLYLFSNFENNKSGKADLSVELPCMEKLELNCLKNIQALQHVLEASIPSNEFSGPPYFLFNEKIKLSSLKELHLEGLDQIWNLWDVVSLHLQSRTYVKSPYFGNLKYMTISLCNNLKSLFPPSIVISLLLLEKLEVYSCDNMEEVITSHEDDTNPTTMITFHKLQTLKLTWMRRLRCFYQGHLLLKFPVLRELDLDDLMEMRAFTLPNTQLQKTEGTEPLFDGEIDFPSLENLKVSWMDIELLQRLNKTTIFPNLSALSLRGLPSLKALPHFNSRTLRFLNLEEVESLVLSSAFHEPTHVTSTSIIMSWELEELRLAELDSLEELFDDEKLVDNRHQCDVKLFFSLRRLELVNLKQMKSVPWNMLTNLRSLIIYSGLEGWSSLISTAMLLGGGVLPLLESIKVETCPNLEAIISKELVEDWDLVKYGITVCPSLKTIILHGLLRLESFSLGSYEAHFPSLETVEISDCILLQSFSMGPLRTPRLKSVKVDSETREANTFGDINAMIAAAQSAERTTQGSPQRLQLVAIRPQKERRVRRGGVGAPAPPVPPLSLGFSGITSTNKGFPESSRFSLAASGNIDGEILQTPNLKIFNFSELKTATRNFRSDYMLEKVDFGELYKGWIDDQLGFVAVIKVSSHIKQGFEEWQSKVSFLGSLSHPHLVKLHGYCWEDQGRLLVYEFMPKGSLYNHLFQSSRAVLTWNRRIAIALGAALGLEFLHASPNKVIYRDFKTSNILLDEKFNAKLCTYSLAMFGALEERSNIRTSVFGTFVYAAPEHIVTGYVSVESDVYAFGVVLLELLTGLRAIDHNRPSGQINLVHFASSKLSNKKKLYTIMDPYLEGQYSRKAAHEAAQLTLKCLMPNPKSRPSMEKVVNVLQQIEAMGGKDKTDGISSSSTWKRQSHPHL